MLRDILREKKCFKLVCGAGNEDIEEVEKLVALYAKAGANYFDLSARPEVVEAAYNGLQRVIPLDKQKDYYFNVSVGIKGDPHASKAFITQELCTACGICKSVCIQQSVNQEDDTFVINNKRCIEPPMFLPTQNNDTPDRLTHPCSAVDLAQSDRRCHLYRK